MSVNWFDFYEDRYDKIKKAFEYGTINSETQIDNNNMMELAINEYSERTMKVLLDYGFVVTNNEWKLAIVLNRYEFVKKFLYHGYEPDLKVIQDDIRNNATCQLLTRYYCKKSVLELLCISKKFKQPISHMLVSISKFLHNTKNDIIWIKINK